MIGHHGELRRTLVYGRSGEAIVERVQVPNPPDVSPEGHPLRASEMRARNVMSNDVICAYEDLEVSALTELVVRHRIGCVPIVDRLGRAIGMVTKTDLVEHLEASMRSESREHRPSVKRARDIMMPLALSLPESASPSQIANLMVLEDVHHVVIVSEAGFLVGVVSTKDLVRWLVDNDRFAAG
ncbi:MAG: HPP family protein [Kofleriaceae bacterium]